MRRNDSVWMFYLNSRNYLSHHKWFQVSFSTFKFVILVQHGRSNLLLNRSKRSERMMKEVIDQDERKEKEQLFENMRSKITWFEDEIVKLLTLKRRRRKTEKSWRSYLKRTSSTVMEAFYKHFTQWKLLAKSSNHLSPPLHSLLN